MLARCIYNRLHGWLVSTMHTELCATPGCANVLVIIDPPGFEVSKTANSYSHFLRNFCSEKIFKMVDDLAYLRAKEDLMRDDCIMTSGFAYPDNRSIIELFEAPKGGLVQLISQADSGSEFISLVQKNHPVHGKLAFPKTTAGKKPTHLILRHRCGAVAYYPSDFMTLDKDVLQPEIFALVGRSASNFLKSILFSIRVEKPAGFSTPQTHTGSLIQHLAGIARVLKEARDRDRARARARG